MTSDGHRNHVGIGVDRASYNKLRKIAKKNNVSMRQLVHFLTKDLPNDYVVTA